MAVERIKPLQHFIDKNSFDDMEAAARGEPFHPSMKDYKYMFCVFVFFKNKIKELEARIEQLEGATSIE